MAMLRTRLQQAVGGDEDNASPATPAGASPLIASAKATAQAEGRRGSKEKDGAGSSSDDADGGAFAAAFDSYSAELRATVERQHVRAVVDLGIDGDELDEDSKEHIDGVLRETFGGALLGCEQAVGKLREVVTASMRKQLKAQQTVSLMKLATARTAAESQVRIVKTSIEAQHRKQLEEALRDGGGKMLSELKEKHDALASRLEELTKASSLKDDTLASMRALLGSSQAEAKSLLAEALRLREVVSAGEAALVTALVSAQEQLARRQVQRADLTQEATEQPPKPAYAESRLAIDLEAMVGTLESAYQDVLVLATENATAGDDGPTQEQSTQTIRRLNEANDRLTAEMSTITERFEDAAAKHEDEADELRAALDAAHRERDEALASLAEGKYAPPPPPPPPPPRPSTPAIEGVPHSVVVQLREEMEHLRRERDEAAAAHAAEVSRLQARIAAGKDGGSKQFADAQAEARQLREHARALSRQLEEARKLYREAQIALEDASSQLSTSAAERKVMEEQMASMQEELAAYRGDPSSAGGIGAQYREAREGLQRAKKTITWLCYQLEEAAKEKEDLQAKSKAEKSELVRSALAAMQALRVHITQTLSGLRVERRSRWLPDKLIDESMGGKGHSTYGKGEKIAEAELSQAEKLLRMVIPSSPPLTLRSTYLPAAPRSPYSASPRSSRATTTSPRHSPRQRGEQPQQHEPPGASATSLSPMTSLGLGIHGSPHRAQTNEGLRLGLGAIRPGTSQLAERPNLGDRDLPLESQLPQLLSTPRAIMNRRHHIDALREGTPQSAGAGSMSSRPWTSGDSLSVSSWLAPHQA